MSQRLTACGSCPFSRKSTPGALGGSPIETYIGQSVGPFFLPCHCAKGYKGNDEKIETCGCQCAGAAIFRANIGLAHVMPEVLLHLPPSSDPNVFSSMTEFISHHLQTTDEAVITHHLARRPIYFLEEIKKARDKGGIQQARTPAAQQIIDT